MGMSYISCFNGDLPLIYVFDVLKIKLPSSKLDSIHAVRRQWVATNKCSHRTSPDWGNDDPCRVRGNSSRGGRLGGKKGHTQYTTIKGYRFVESLQHFSFMKHFHIIG